MENPIHTVENLPKTQRYIVIGGAVGLGGLLVYRSHQKNLAAAQAQDQGGQNTDTGSASDGTSQDGTMDGSSPYDPSVVDPNTGVPYADEASGMAPYGTDPYSDMYNGGIGYTSGGLYDPALAGAGDIMGTTATQPSATDINVHVTGGGAPKTDANKHHAGSTKKRHSGGSHRKTVHHHPTAGEHTTTHHKTVEKGRTAKQGRDKKRRR